ncbi:multifunctional methyltransferase subunit TRM112 homolog A-like [Dioscorea cayenensis subsp. rotundata]|uniref:Multifunctional methyltransferase subunit TRM112 homolog A-like n=1 Tax=Dioscorea cayennensis subsp. rotundata TaxID=55577 RepID=A0AB40C866_DIOCR|nr:multifunctional methyltransferase subunit TRM112 homolog A-like [Dioscorea cayenensis subsp. rotundata]
MRLLTHNMVSNNVKGVVNGFSLCLKASTWVEKEVNFNVGFLRSIFPKIDWPALFSASQTVGYVTLPNSVEANMLKSEDFLKKFNHALSEIHVEEGALVCPETVQRFPINKMIPNMLLNKDEV